MFLIYLTGDRLPVSLVEFDYPFLQGKKFIFYFLFFHVSFPFLLFLFFALFFPPPAPGLHEASYTKRNSTRVVLQIWKIWKRELEEAEVDWPNSVLSTLTQFEARKGKIYICLSAVPFFVKLERSGISLQQHARACRVDCGQMENTMDVRPSGITRGSLCSRD